MKTAIIGTRTAPERTYWQLCDLCGCLQVLGGISEIISGGAAGADALGERYATAEKIPLTVIIADWQKHGKAAGPMRNTEIVERADQIIAIWDGQSTGTADTIRKAKAQGKEVMILRYEAEPKAGAQMSLF